ncbi:MAG: DUF1761 domain-containing protein [Candidatus Iainarchaeum archaeon]|uniref:DUF1761 domain-containing protein n=1 Tax=Candidatus Iainarchaeum sp. TaxID=3101447 RepID=A0A7T9DIZ6_9ARCH|nr:MAG: DUF1761 domain-containing protein [Candidatus Diapherotrites archaeon]
MQMITVDVNITNVVITAVVAFIVGWLWHSPMLFGKQWMKLMGKNMKDMGKMDMSKMAQPMAIQFVAAIIMAYVLSHILSAYQTLGWSEALQGAFWVWLGFIAATSINQVLWEGRSWNLWLFNNAYHLVSLIVMAVVLVSL